MRYVESLNKSLYRVMSEDERVYILGEDILDPYGGAFKVTKGLSVEFPDRVITTPISEAAITGFAIGMALRGFLPVVEIMFGDFITLCTDQIVNNATKFPWMYNHNVQVPIVIRTPMGGRRGYGPTHSQTLETLFLNIPGFKIVAPAHVHNAGDLLYTCILHEKEPVLFIENKLLYGEQLKLPGINNKIDDFFVYSLRNHNELYESISMKLVKDEQPDITLVTYGGMTLLALEAALNVFMEKEILIEVIIPSLVKPLPLQDIIPSVEKSKRLIILEESIVTAGWGTVFARHIYDRFFGILRRPVELIGAKDMPIPASKSLENQVLPQIEDIERVIYKLIDL